MTPKATMAALLIAACGLIGCSGQSDTASAPYQEEFGDPPLGGKADLLDDLAEPIALGETKSGKVEQAGTQGDRRVYVITLRIGDRFVLEMTTKRNTLKPDFLLYYGTTVRVHSESFELEGQDLTTGVKVLRKEYVADSAGRYSILVRAYQGVGSGSYELSASCKGGPCNGEFPDPQALQFDEAATCIWRARGCAFGKLPQEPAAPTAERAQAMFEGCIGEVSLDDGRGCKRACEYLDEDDDWPTAAHLCQGIADSLTFFYGKDAECMRELNDCLDICEDLAEYSYYSEEFGDTFPYVCLEGGFNSNCDSYARGLSTCGGTEWVADTYDACCALVKATDGAWTDDMDTLCWDACGHQ